MERFDVSALQAVEISNKTVEPNLEELREKRRHRFGHDVRQKTAIIVGLCA